MTANISSLCGRAASDLSEKARDNKKFRMLEDYRTPSEFHRDSAIECHLVGVLCVSNHIAAPPRIAPPPGCV